MISDGTRTDAWLVKYKRLTPAERAFLRAGNTPGESEVGCAMTEDRTPEELPRPLTREQAALADLHADVLVEMDRPIARMEFRPSSTAHRPLFEALAPHGMEFVQQQSMLTESGGALLAQHDYHERSAGEGTLAFVSVDPQIVADLDVLRRELDPSYPESRCSSEGMMAGRCMHQVGHMGLHEAEDEHGEPQMWDGGAS